MLHFASDYMEGAHPELLRRLLSANLEHNAGYGTDVHSERARGLIRAACAAPQAEVHFLAGGTQANACVISTALRPWQGVIAADTGHIATHEAGAIEHGGHKVITLPSESGKISAAQVEASMRAWEADDNRDHTVHPGMVYVSMPTEYGTLYSCAELEALSATCHAHGLLLYVDGARLAYALACPANDVALADLARLCDAFYLGGTKCGCLFGEAVVLPRPGVVEHFFTQAKQRGALLAKGFVAGLQFEALFEDGLYERLGIPAIEGADRIRAALAAKGIAQAYDSPTNQVFLTLGNSDYERLRAQVEMSFWGTADPGCTTVRLATSWATTPADVDALIALL